MTEAEAELLAVLSPGCIEILAWCVLPNHYHVLVASVDILRILADLGRFHGRSSYRWNGEDRCRGRKCWHRCAEREMRTDRHKWATLNYVHHNPVHHGYVEHWQDWPYSSAAQFLEEVGPEAAREYWRAYPLLDYGRGWDDPEM
jgi:putative transposase